MHSAQSALRALLLGGSGGMPPRKFLKNKCYKTESGSKFNHYFGLQAWLNKESDSNDVYHVNDVNMHVFELTSYIRKVHK